MRHSPGLRPAEAAGFGRAGGQLHRPSWPIPRDSPGGMSGDILSPVAAGPQRTFAQAERAAGDLFLGFRPQAENHHE